MEIFQLHCKQLEPSCATRQAATDMIPTPMPFDWGNDITDGILRSFIEGWLQLLRYQSDQGY